MIKEVILGTIKKAVGDLNPKWLTEGVDLEYPPLEAFGHYSTNLAFKIAKLENKTPLMISQELVAEINKSLPKDFFERVEVKAPGFINFYLKSSVFQDEIQQILKTKEKYGSGLIEKKQASNIQIEFISANPTGPLVVVGGRGGFLGDVIANILEFVGHHIEREYYVNDSGNQVITLGKSILAALGLREDEESFYKGDYIKAWAKKNKLKIKKSSTPLSLGRLASKDFLKEIKRVVEKKAKIKFDRFTSELTHIDKKGFIPKVLKVFRKNYLSYKEDGAEWLKTTKFGDDKDRVLVTSEATPTYFLSDAGHYLETKLRGFDEKILILGPDHYGYVKRIQAVAKITGLKKSTIILTQTVSLVDSGERVKMSKREGNFVTLEELIDTVGSDATRFFFLMYSPETHFDFDLGLAKEKSNKNPVYYVQYAAVRCGSIINKVKSEQLKVRGKSVILSRQAKDLSSKQNLELLTTKEDLSLMRMLIRFPEIVGQAGEKLSPQLLVRYTMDLAKEFHNFYEKERIIGEAENIIQARLALLQSTHLIFKSLFKLLGIDLLTKM